MSMPKLRRSGRDLQLFTESYGQPGTDTEVMSKISGPLLDRIEISVGSFRHVEVPTVKYAEL